MKIEPRGKYAGVKVHLGGSESQMLIDMWNGSWDENPHTTQADAFSFAGRLGMKIYQLLKEHPNLLEDRSEEQIAEALQRDKDKIEQQQLAMKKGKDWKKV